MKAFVLCEQLSFSVTVFAIFTMHIHLAYTFSVHEDAWIFSDPIFGCQMKHITKITLYIETEWSLMF